MTYYPFIEAFIAVISFIFTFLISLFESACPSYLYLSFPPHLNQIVNIPNIILTFYDELKH